MQIITATDLASYLRDPGVTVTDADVFLRLANGIVAAEVADLDPLPARVQAITLEVAARAYRNPNGYSSETIDDYTYRRDADTRQAGVYLTSAERGELQAMSGSAVVRSMYVVDLGTPYE